MRRLWGTRGEDDPRYNYILGAGVRVGACLTGTLTGRSEGVRWGWGLFTFLSHYPSGVV